MVAENHGRTRDEMEAKRDNFAELDFSSVFRPQKGGVPKP